MGVLSMVDSRARATMAPLQVQVVQSDKDLAAVKSGQGLLWEKLGGKLDNLSEKIDTLSNTVAVLAQKQADQNAEVARRSK